MNVRRRGITAHGPIAHPAVAIRPARVSDLDAIAALEHEAFTGDRLSRRSLQNFIRAGDRLLVATEPDGLTGYALVTWRKGGRRARLYSIAVHAGKSGRGVGRALLDAVEARALAQGCAAIRHEVREDNKRAIDHYERRGYRRFGRLEGYYEDGAAALRLEKPLSTSSPRKKSRR
jgi:[ribosomal protein S18]-alanine N-acetyltransferase